MSQETPISAAVTDFVVTTDSRIYEDEILDLAKRCLVDWIGVSIGGTVEALDPVIRGAAIAIPSQGKARVLMGATMAPAIAGRLAGVTGLTLYLKVLKVIEDSLGRHSRQGTQGKQG